ncbi:hypothetical protein AK830_g705 [Neonectria ditissima]|uniref:Zn(2)-C6 fungal-type domain-containing protein n=1 Tax=Neonectria ditissima TaxID=78410 RepID=A0A0N8H8X9_9HYPO|nr:hypothetical protein AK830_g705 [Neonectria ditissima]
MDQGKGSESQDWLCHLVCKKPPSLAFPSVSKPQGVLTVSLSKIRHLKCDEAKPQCQRCEKDGHVCDGYETVLTRKTKTKSKESQLRESQLVLRRKELAVNASPLPLVTADACQLPTEMDLFHHVRTCTIQDLGTALTPTEFWYMHALPLGHAVEPVKYAICALGGAHKHFKSQLLGTSGGSVLLQGLEEVAIQQYNQAIHHIKSFTRTPSKKNMEVILTCCVIFICIENLLGRYSESLRHLQAGCALLLSLRQLSAQEAMERPESLQQEEAREKSVFFNEIAAMLSRLSQDLAMYMGMDVIPELYFYTTPTIEFQSLTTPFDSATAAAKLLFTIETEFSARLYLTEQHLAKSSGAGSCDADSTYWTMKPGCLQDDKFQLEAMESVYLNWSTRFDLFRGELDEGSMPKEELYRIMMLAIGQSVWAALLKLKSFDDDLEMEACEEILRRAEALVQSEVFGSIPVYSFDANLIPAISLVCTSCKNIGIQRRGVRLLRSIRRREGIWDSQEVADILDAMVIARERDLLSWDLVPWKLPQLARLVSSLPLGQFRISKGALSLAEQDME